MYLLDTNTVIYFFKGMGNVAKNMFEKSPQEICIPSLVVYELEVGIAKSNDPKKREAQLSKLLSYVQIVEFGEREAKASAAIRAKLEAKGTPIGPIDTLIAGCAKANNCTLVTRNLAEFQRVEGLELENWYG
ncbi:MAG: type II toxin-antitoxin system VapC family toxin [Sulfurimonadaceae bacterium]